MTTRRSPHPTCVCGHRQSAHVYTSMAVSALSIVVNGVETVFALSMGAGGGRRVPSPTDVSAEETRLGEARGALLQELEVADLRDEDGDSLMLPILLAVAGAKK